MRLDSAGATQSTVVGVTVGLRRTATSPQKVASKAIPHRLGCTVWAAMTPRLPVAQAVMPHHAAMTAPTPEKTVGATAAAVNARTQTSGWAVAEGTYGMLICVFLTVCHVCPKKARTTS